MDLPLKEIWTRVFEIVRRQREMPTVWLAMQAVIPLTIDGNFFVAILPPTSQYLALNLQDNESATAIEDALRTVTGRILAFRLIAGQTVADWEREKLGETAPHIPNQSVPAPAAPAPPAPVPPRPQKTASREISASWEKLNERLNHGYKTAPYIKYAHGQAQFVLTAVQIISDTMDLLMPAPGLPRDEVQERALARVVERLGTVVNLDPIFLSLELLHYRQLQGKFTEILL